MHMVSLHFRLALLMQWHASSKQTVGVEVVAQLQTCRLLWLKSGEEAFVTLYPLLYTGIT